MKCNSPAWFPAPVLGGKVGRVSVVKRHAAAFDRSGMHLACVTDVPADLQIKRLVNWRNMRQDVVLVLVAIVKATVGGGRIVESNPDSQRGVQIIGSKIVIVLMDGFGATNFRWFHEYLTEEQMNFLTDQLLDHGNQ